MDSKIFERAKQRPNNDYFSISKNFFSHLHNNARLKKNQIDELREKNAKHLVKKMETFVLNEIILNPECTFTPKLIEKCTNT